MGTSPDGVAPAAGLAERFERERPRLRSMAYRMLGSTAEADDAVQEAWLRLARVDADGLDSLGAWLTTVVTRICLNVLRARTIRGEGAARSSLPDPVIDPDPAGRPEDEAVLADSVGLALLVVLDTLAPAERLALVLHDMFGVPFEEIAAMVERSPAATRQLTSRARRRLRDAAVPTADQSPARQREVVDAFFAAARGGDLEALIALLDPHVVLRGDGGVARPEVTRVLHGAAVVARQARAGANPESVLLRARINGAPGVVITLHGEPQVAMAFTVVDSRVAEIDVYADPDRIRRLAASVLPPS